MTDLDPLEKPQREGADLPARAGRELPHDPRYQVNEQMAGPAGRQMTTESVGDPDRSSVASGAEAGAGAGALAGAAVAGPFGLPVGAAAGAVAGGAAEAADEDKSTNEERPGFDYGSEGTTLIDPATDYDDHAG